MSASEEKLDVLPKQLGIIAGGGVLPSMLLHACDHKGIEPFIVGFEGQTDPSLVEGRNHMWSRLGASGQVVKTLQSHEITDLVLIGAMKRPSFSELRPDMKTAEFFAKVAMRALGDNDLLMVIREMLEKEGFVLHGVHKFVDDLLAPEGLIGRYKPKKDDWIDIRRGINISQELGAQDVGQSAIVQEGIVLGVEAAEGTDALIKRCKHLKRKGRKGVLVKTCKPQQDVDFDLPTIGPQTILNAAESNLAGVVMHAGLSLLIEPQRVAEIANHHKMFVIGVDPLKE